MLDQQSAMSSRMGCLFKCVPKVKQMPPPPITRMLFSSFMNDWWFTSIIGLPSMVWFWKQKIPLRDLDLKSLSLPDTYWYVEFMGFLAGQVDKTDTWRAIIPIHSANKYQSIVDHVACMRIPVWRGGNLRLSESAMMVSMDWSSPRMHLAFYLQLFYLKVVLPVHKEYVAESVFDFG